MRGRGQVELKGGVDRERAGGDDLEVVGVEEAEGG